MPRNLTASLFLLCFLGAPATQAGPNFSTLVVLGDSLSDNGNLFAYSTANLPVQIPDPTYYDQGRFQNGPNYAEHLWHDLGFAGDLTPYLANPAGTNFAIGGARSRYSVFNLDGSGLPPAAGGGVQPFSLLWQVALYRSLTGGVADPNALYDVWLGSNDLFDAVNVQFQVGALQADALRAQALGDVVTAIAVLVADGAESLLIPNIPDIGLTPELLANPVASALGTQFAQEFNDSLNLYLSTLIGVTVFRYDTFSFLQEAVAHPADLGFSNVDEPCLTGFFVAPPPTGSVAVCGTPDQYLFWDLIHPSATAQVLLGSEMRALIPEPASLALFGIGLVGLGRSAVARRRALV